MKEIGVSIRLRPVRFAFLVKPGDAKNLKRIFEINSCLWGGLFNPIIPYFERVPRWWDRHPVRFHNARRIIGGYLSFFEPDFVVEAERGLSAKLDLPKEVVLYLDDILMPETERQGRKAYGLNVFELYRDLYRREFQFMLRHKHGIVTVTPEDRKYILFVSCVFGAFPKEDNLTYIGKAYNDAFGPETVKLNSEKLILLYKRGATSALRIGYDKIKVSYSDLHNPTLFVLDATQPQDLIDFWNLRAIQRNVWAIPIQWIKFLSKFCKDFIIRNHIPLPNNPHGVMIHTTIQISRSISEKRAEEIWRDYLKVPTQGAASLRVWYPSFWEKPSDLVWSPLRPVLTAKKNRIEVRITDTENAMIFDPLSPDFVGDYGNDYRWANVIELENTLKTDIATVFPNNLRTPSFPRLNIGERMLVNTEGFITYPRYKDIREYWRIPDGSTALVKWFKTQGVEAEISEAGKTTIQMIEALEGPGGVRRIGHPKIIELLNKMAHKEVKVPSENGEVKEKVYYGHHVHYGELKRLINEISQSGIWSKYSLEAIGERNVIRLGLEVECGECGHKNWYAIDALDYILSCESCLKKFIFPAANPTNRKVNWSYRAIGPFSKPDYAQGAYTSVLAIRFFSYSLGHDNAVTWSTSLKFKLKSGKESEADFVLWYQRKRLLENNYEPQMVFGECKSFGKECFQQKDVLKLKILGSFFPGSILVFATMKEELSKAEKKIISSLALWGRRYSRSSEYRAPVIVLTGTELFAPYMVEVKWEEKGGKHAEFVEPASVRLENLNVLADLTQQLYLDLPSYHEWREAKWKKKAAKKKSGLDSTVK